MTIIRYAFVHHVFYLMFNLRKAFILSFIFVVELLNFHAAVAASRARWRTTWSSSLRLWRRTASTSSSNVDLTTGFKHVFKLKRLHLNIITCLLLLSKISFHSLIFRIGVLHENQAPTGPETKQGFKNKSKKVKKGEEKSKKAITNTKTALDFFRDIPTSKIRKLYQHYRHDFEIFGYSGEEYLNIESSWSNSWGLGEQTQNSSGVRVIIKLWYSYF